jgi:uncharacterized Zn-finger protein
LFLYLSFFCLLYLDWKTNDFQNSTPKRVLFEGGSSEFLAVLPMEDLPVNNHCFATPLQNIQTQNHEQKTVSFLTLPSLLLPLSTLPTPASPHAQNHEQKTVSFLTLPSLLLPLSTLPTPASPHAQNHEQKTVSFLTLPSLLLPLSTLPTSASPHFPNLSFSTNLSEEFNENSNLIDDCMLKTKTKTKEAKFVCEVCQKSFTQKGGLVNHRRIHTGEKPYKCDHCVKRFTQKCNLTRHLRIHTGEKPYQCQFPTCHKRFNRKWGLEIHTRTHKNYNNTQVLKKCIVVD